MTQVCEALEKCGFFNKYQGINNLACTGFINQYCKGEKLHDCERKKYREKHGQPPSDDMMPSGQMVSK
jgi:hypothetical protein